MTDQEKLAKIRRKSIFISYLIGASAGLVVIVTVLGLSTVIPTELLVLTGGMFILFGKATAGLLVSFLIALWYAGKKIPEDLLNRGSVTDASFRYSLRVNVIIWTVFTVVIGLFYIPIIKWSFLILLVFPFVAGVLITTFSIGLLICYWVQQTTNRLLRDELV